MVLKTPKCDAEKVPVFPACVRQEKQWTQFLRVPFDRRCNLILFPRSLENYQGDFDRLAAVLLTKKHATHHEIVEVLLQMKRGQGNPARYRRVAAR